MFSTSVGNGKERGGEGMVLGVEGADGDIKEGDEGVDASDVWRDQTC